MTGPVEAHAWVRLGGSGRGLPPWAPWAALAVLALMAAKAGADAVTALVSLLVSLVVLAAIVVAVVLVLRSRREAWRPYGTDSRISTGPRRTAGLTCAVCAPVLVPATAVVCSPKGELLGLCTPHVHAADLIVRRALPPGDPR